MIAQRGGGHTTNAFFRFDDASPGLRNTGKRGCVVESLYLRVREGSRDTEFSFWGIGDKDLVRGSGLFVPESGVASNHHFNPTDAETAFTFTSGTYSVEMVAHVIDCSTKGSRPWR